MQALFFSADQSTPLRSSSTTVNMWPLNPLISFFQVGEARYVLTPEGEIEHCPTVTSPLHIPEVRCTRGQGAGQHIPQKQDVGALPSGSNKARSPIRTTFQPLQPQLRRSSRKRRPKLFFDGSRVEPLTKTKRIQRRVDRTYVDRVIPDSPAPSPQLARRKKPLQDPTYKHEHQDDDLSPVPSPIAGRPRKRRMRRDNAHRDKALAGSKAVQSRRKKHPVDPRT